MGNENPNAQIEANLLDGKNRYASAGTTLQDIKLDLDNIAADLQSSWLGPACQDYQDKQGKLTTTVQSASDVLQKGSTSIGKMYDSYIEADEKQKQDKEIHETLEMFMGVFMIVTSLLGLIGPILEAADLLFAAEIEALDIGIEVGEVATDVAEDVAIEEVETLSNLDTLGDIGPLNEEIPIPVDGPVEAPPLDAPVEPPLDAPVEPPLDAPAEPPLDASVEPPNVEEPSGEPIQEPSKHDSGIDLSQDEQDFLGKLDEPTVSEQPKDIAPQEPVQVNTVHTDVPDSPLTSPEYGTPEAGPSGDITTTTTETTSMVPGNDVTTTTVTDSNGNVVSVTTTTNKTDAWGNTTTIEEVADGDGNVISKTLDFPDEDQSVTVNEPDGSSTTTNVNYDPNGDVTETQVVTTANGEIESVTTTTVRGGTDANGDPIATETETVQTTSTDPVTDDYTIHEETTVTVTDDQANESVTTITTNTKIRPDYTETTITTTNRPDGTVIKTESYSDGTQVAKVTHPNGDTTESTAIPQNNPNTGQPVQIKTTINTATNSQGQPTVTKIVEDPLNGTQTITETVNNADGSQTVTTVVTDTSGQNVISANEQTIPPADPIAESSTASTSAGPSSQVGSKKRPFDEDADSPPPDPSDPKGKKTKF